MAWPLRALLVMRSAAGLAGKSPRCAALIKAVWLVAALRAPLLMAYPTPVDFSGRLLAWPLQRSHPSLKYELTADHEADFAEFAAIVDEAASLWSQSDASFIQLEARQDGDEKEAEISIFLKRMIDNATFSSGYTEFDALDKKGGPLHCSIYIHTDPSFSFNAIAKTILHEIGHCLGLGHSLIPEAIMSYRLTSNHFALDIDDKAALSRLYPADPDAKRLPPGCAIGARPDSSSSSSQGPLSHLGLLLLLGLPILVVTSMHRCQAPPPRR